MANPASDWNRMQDKYYRKIELYQLQWRQVDLNLALDKRIHVAVAPFGGPVATVRNDTKRTIRAITSQQQRPIIRIFSSAGNLISEFATESDSVKPYRLGWTAIEELVCVMDDGTVILYSVHGEYIRDFSMGKEVKLNGMQDVTIYASGIVVLTFNHQLVAIDSFSNPIPKLLAPLDSHDDVTAIAVVDPKFTNGRGVEVIVSTASGAIYTVNQSEAEEHRPRQAAFSHLAISPNGKILAGFTRDFKLRVMLVSFEKLLSELVFETDVPPTQLVWCGVDAVVLYWSTESEHALMMVGPSQDQIKYSFSDALVLAPEIDGIRVLSNDKCEFLQMVPKPLDDIFRIGSMHDAAILYDAWVQFQAQSSKADENIRSIQDALTDAVDTCVNAAGHEFDVGLQKTLLQAACFGKSALDFYTADTFVDMCRTIRVLNQIRNPNIGRPLTLKQLQTLTEPVLIELLTQHHQHRLAVSIGRYLRLGMETERTVLTRWACEKIKSLDSSTDTREAHIQIVSKLRSCPSVSFAQVAATANENGHMQLATTILDYEPRATEQVPLLIRWGRDEDALAKAVASGDTDLVFLTLLHMKDRMPEESFFRVLSTSPQASNLLVTYCREMDLKFLQSFYYVNNRLEEAGHVLILEAYKKERLGDRISGLDLALKFFDRNKEYAFAQKATQDEIRLLRLQMELTAETNRPFVDMSLSDTIFHCFEVGKSSKADSLAKEFKVPDKRFWWLKVKALAHFSLWAELERFANSKKSPIGYQPFFDVCREQRKDIEAVKYIDKLPDVKSKVHALIGLKNFDTAASMAMVSKDQGLVELVEQSRATRRRE